MCVCVWVCVCVCVVQSRSHGTTRRLFSQISCLILFLKCFLNLYIYIFDMFIFIKPFLFV